MGQAVLGIGASVARMGERLGLIRAFRQSESQAKTDPLTGLNNRRSLEAGLAAVARPGAVFAVVYADVDHFKRLNDTYGHDTGDRALRVFASVLRESVRDNDLLARWGGEEFVLVLKDFQAEQAVTVLERIRTHLAGRLVGGSLPAFTASFGVADNGDGGDFKEILDAADAALPAAKAAGRNCIVRAAEARNAADAARAADTSRAADVTRAVDAKCVPAAAAGEDAVAAFLARA